MKAKIKTWTKANKHTRFGSPTLLPLASGCLPFVCEKFIFRTETLDSVNAERKLDRVGKKALTRIISVGLRDVDLLGLFVFRYWAKMTQILLIGHIGFIMYTFRLSDVYMIILII